MGVSGSAGSGAALHGRAGCAAGQSHSHRASSCSLAHSCLARCAPQRLRRCRPWRRRTGGRPSQRRRRRSCRTPLAGWESAAPPSACCGPPAGVGETGRAGGGSGGCASLHPLPGACSRAAAGGRPRGGPAAPCCSAFACLLACLGWLGGCCASQRVLLASCRRGGEGGALGEGRAWLHPLPGVAWGVQQCSRAWGRPPRGGLRPELRAVQPPTHSRCPGRTCCTVVSA